MTLSLGQKDNNLPFTLENCSFLKEAQQSIDEFKKALWEGVTLLKHNADAPKSLLNKMCSTPPKFHLGNTVVMKICTLWGECTASLVNQKGQSVHLSLLQLLQKRKIYPLEFQATIPKLAPANFLKVIRCIAAYGYLFEAFASAKENRPTMVRYNINKAVEWYHKAGIAQNDTSLINFQHTFLARAENLELAGGLTAKHR